MISANRLELPRLFLLSSALTKKLTHNRMNSSLRSVPRGILNNTSFRSNYRHRYRQLLLKVPSVVIFSCVFTGDTSNSVQLKMEESGIAPAIIDVAPQKVVEASFPSGVKAEMGNELTPTQVKDQPTLHWDAEDNALYTVLMVDPDAPAQYKEVRHWLVINIPGNRVAEGQSVIDYVGSGPPQGTGIHRYFFLVFKQQSAIQTDVHVPNTSRQGRIQTITRDLLKEYNLGVPVAGNYYRAQYDDYVPILQARYTTPLPKLE